MTLLLMYPIIAGLFGASALASVVVMQSAKGNIAIQIMGAAIAIIPLAITPLVMKSAGGVLNRFAGMVNDRDKGPIDRMRKSGEKYREGRKNVRNARALNGSKQFGRGAAVRWRARRGAVNNGRQQEANRASTDYIADQIQSKAGFRNSVAGGTLGKKASDEASQRALAGAISAKAKIEADELTAANVVLKNARLDQAQIRAIASGGSATSKNPDGSPGTVFNGGTSNAVRAAAIQSTVASNDVAAMNSLWNSSKSWQGPGGERLREVFADSLQSSSGRPAYIGQGAIAGLRTNSHENIQETIEASLRNNTYSSERIASADKDELNVVVQVLNKSHAAAAQGQVPKVSDNLRQEVILNAENALNDPRIRASIGKNLEQVENIVNFRDPSSKVPVDDLF